MTNELVLSEKKLPLAIVINAYDMYIHSTYTHAFKRYDKYVYDDNIHRHKVFKMVDKVFFK